MIKSISSPYVVASVKIFFRLSTLYDAEIFIIAPGLV